MPLDDQLVTMSEKQLWQAFVLQNLNFQWCFSLIVDNCPFDR